MTTSSRPFDSKTATPILPLSENQSALGGTAKIFLTAYGPKTRVSLSCPELPFGRTKQSFAAECNINTIMANFQATGLVAFVNKNQGQYADVVGLDFQTSVDQIVAAQRMFDELPALWRKKFHNNPHEFIEFVEDAGNREEAIKMGLITPKAETVVTPKGDPGKPNSGDPAANLGVPGDVVPPGKTSKTS